MTVVTQRAPDDRVEQSKGLDEPISAYDARPVLDLSVGQRLAVGFGTMLLLLALLLGVALSRLQHIQALERRQTEILNPRIDLAADLQIAYLRLAVAARSYTLTREERHLVEFREAAQESRAGLSQLERLPQEAAGASILSELNTLSEEYIRTTSRFVDLIQQGADAATLTDAENDLTQRREQLVERLRAYVALQDELRQQASAETERAVREAIQVLLGLAGSVLLVGAATALVVTRTVQSPARRLLTATRALAAGDYEPALRLRPTAALGSDGLSARPRDELRELAQSFGAMAAALQERVERLAAHGRVSTVLAASLDVERLANDALREVIRYTAAEFGAVYVREPDDARLYPIASYALEGRTAPLVLGEGIPGQAAASREPIVVRNLPPDAPYRVRFGFDKLPPRTIAAVPLIVNEQVLGVLLVGSVRELSTDALSFVEQVASQLGVSLQNARVHRDVERLAAEHQAMNEQLAAQNAEIQGQSEELQTQGEELSALNEELSAQNEELEQQRQALAEANEVKDVALARERAIRAAAERAAERIARLQAVTARLSGAVTPEQVVDLAITTGLSAVGAVAGVIDLLNEDQTELHLVGAVGYPDEIVSTFSQQSLDTPIPTVDAVRTGQPVWLESGDELVHRYPAAAWMQSRTGYGAFAALPLVAHGRLLGTIGVHFADARTFSVEERAFIIAVAQQCAQALDRARLFEAEQRARAKAQDAVQMRDRVFSLVSHDLKNPLGAIKGLAQLLQRRLSRSDGLQPENLLDSLARIDQMATSMSAQLDELLDVARLQMGQPLQLNRDRTDFAALAQQIVDEYQRSTERHTIRVEAATTSSLVGEWDRARLQRVLGNLLSNAIKYSPDGGEIVVTVERVDEAAGAWAVVSVRDQGLGIPAADLPFVFEPFKRAGNVAQQIVGTGLGLASARQIIEQHGGTITVTSQENAGSTFSIRLPLEPSLSP